jgi:hypothetical protein
MLSFLIALGSLLAAQAPQAPNPTLQPNPTQPSNPMPVYRVTVSPEGVRQSYQAHANCYVQKPTNLERSVKLVQALEAFWMDFALLPSCDGRKSET